MGSIKTISVNYSVDCIVFGFDERELKVLLIERGAEPFKGEIALPGDLIRVDETIDAAAARVLAELTGLTDIVLKQLHTFGEVDRHPWGRTITTAYYPIIKVKDNPIHPSSFAVTAKWYTITDIPTLAFDHNKIVEHALKSLKESVTKQPIGLDLLPVKFTLPQLQTLYEVILETQLDKRNFRRKFLNLGLITPLNEKQKGVPHKAAQLYQFDKSRYTELTASGFHFDI